MSTGRKWGRAEALEVAEGVRRALAPRLRAIELAGSLRRGSEAVGDIEFVATPLYRADLFEEAGAPSLQPVREKMRELGTWVRGGDRMMQVGGVLGRPGLKLELYLVLPPAQWGSILAIRTGPKELGQACVSRMIDRKLRHRAGRVIHAPTGKEIPTPEERDFFALAEVPFLPPHEREDLARRILRGELEPASEWRASA